MGNITIHQDKIRKDGFTVVGNTILRDNRVTARAKGVFCYLLNLPPDWTLHIDELAKNFAEGRDAIRKAISELIDFGYVVKIVEMNGNLKGRTHYNICECPERSQVTESRGTKTRYAENPTLINTYDNKDLDNNNLNSNSSEPNGSSEFANDESAKVSEDSDNTSSSPTTSEDSLSQTSNTFSTSTITQTPKEKESVPAKEKEKVSPRDVVAHYSERWEIMRERGHVNTDCPPQSYPMIGKLVKSSGATLEQLQKVIDEGFKHPDPIILNSGYPLRTMLSSWWVNKVLNGSLEDPNKNRYSKQPASPNKLNKNAKYSEENWKHEKL